MKPERPAAIHAMTCGCATCAPPVPGSGFDSFTIACVVLVAAGIATLLVAIIFTFAGGV